MHEKHHKSYRRKAVNSSLWVAIFTTVGFLGFFIRDYLMAKVYGFGSQLDSFYLVTMLPMFMVSVFCIPFGQAVIPKLKRMKHLSDEKFLGGVRYFSFLAVFFCGFLCILSYLSSDFIIFMLHHFGWVKINANVKLMELSVLPILFLSGLVILSNSVLSVNERYIYPSLAQLVVPISAIFFLLFFGQVYGIYAVIFGMVIGQLINFICVCYGLNRDSVRIFPFEFDFKIPGSFWIGYAHLVTIAIFTSVLTLINTFIATSLGEGAASIYNLGTKFSMFLIGVITALFTTILLPYLSRLSTYENKNVLNRETYYLLLTTTFVFIPFSLAIFLGANLISKFIFSHIVSDSAIVLGIESVIKYSVIQLPFWVFNAILFRHANAINRVGIITISSILILILDLFFAFKLIKFMSVGGLALSMTVSSAIAANLMLIYYVLKKHLKLFEGLIILGSWLVFGLILIQINFDRLLDLFNKVI